MNKKLLLFSALLLLAVPASAAVPADFGLREGDMISAVGSNDPDIYIINEHGYKRLFLNPVIFNFYGHLGGWGNVKTVVPATKDAFPTTTLFRNCEANDPKVYAVEVTGEDTGTVHHVDIAGDAAVQQDPNFFKKVFCINNNEFNWYPKSPVVYHSVNQIPPYSRDGTPNPTPTPTPTPPTPTPLPPVSWKSKAVTAAKGASLWPAVAFDGTNFGVAWIDDRTGAPAVYFALLDKNGNKLTNDRQVGSVAGSDISARPDIIWDGGRFVVAYSNSTNVVLVRFSPQGSRVLADINLDSGCHAKLSYNGLAYGIATQSPCAANGTLFFTYVNGDGVKLVNRQTIVQEGGDARTRIVSHGNSFGITYNAAGRTRFTRVEINGNRIANNILISDAAYLTSAWNGSTYALITAPNHFSTFDMNGGTMMPRTPFSLSVSEPDMLWNGSVYGVLDGKNFYELSASGSVFGQATVTSNTPIAGGRLSWDTDRYGALWQDGSTDPFTEAGNEHFELWFGSDK